MSQANPQPPLKQASDPSMYRVDFKAMASACEIVIAAQNQDEAYRCIELAINEVRRIEKKYTRYQPDSIVSRINTAAGQAWVAFDDETEALFNYADTLYNISDGLFDITSGILRQAWNFNTPVLPSQSQLSALLNLIGWQQVERKEQQIKLPKAGMEIDFGGFGKEYAADRAATLLATNGIKHGYINLGGDLRAIGTKPTGEPWVMGILNPREKGAVIASIPVTVGALATSGDYEKFFDLDGKRYCHVVSPRTGQPVSYWRSVSVLAPLSINAGTYTTIAMLKEADGLAWLEDSGMAYLAIDHAGQVYQKQS
jgi:thiamine biosynthesis lipoprotein